MFRILLLSLSCFVVLAQNPFPKLIWAYWSNQNSEPSAIVKIFALKMVSFFKRQPGWSMYIVNDQNYRQVLQNYQQYQNALSKIDNPHPAAKSDLLRLFLLQAKGGVWVDITSTFTEDFSWISHLQSDENVINRDLSYSLEPDVFIFFWDKHQYRNSYWSLSGNHMNNFPGYESWFIAAKQGAPFIRDWKQNFVKHYYSVGTDQAFNRMRKYDVYLTGFDYEDYHRVYYSLYEMLTRKQTELDLNATILNRVNSNVYYKVWAVQCSIGPCLSYSGSPNSKPMQNQKLFMTTNEQQFFAYHGLQKQRYFIKFINYLTRDVQKMFQWYSTEELRRLKLVEIYKVFKKFNPNIQCKQFTFFVEDSFVFSRILRQQQFKFAHFTAKDREHFYKFCDNLEAYQLSNQVVVTQMSTEEIFTLISKYLFYLYLIYIAWLYCQMCFKILFNKNHQSTPNAFEIQPLCPIDYICQKLISLLKKFRLFIPFPLVSCAYMYIVYTTTISYELNCYKQKYAQVAALMLLCCFMHKFNKINQFYSYFTKLWMNVHAFAEQFIYLCISKLISDLLFNTLQRTIPCMFFLGILMPQLVCSVKNIQTKIQFIDNLNQKLKGKHFFISTIVLCIMLFVPNLMYITIGGIYLRILILKLVILYAIYLTFLIVYTFLRNKYLNVKFNSINKQQMKRSFNSIRKAITAYWIVYIVFFYHLQFYKHHYNRTELVMSYLFALVGFLSITYSPNYQIKEETQTQKQKQRKNSLNLIKQSQIWDDSTSQLIVFLIMGIFYFVLFQCEHYQDNYDIWSKFFGYYGYYEKILKLIMTILMVIKIRSSLLSSNQSLIKDSTSSDNTTKLRRIRR